MTIATPTFLESQNLFADYLKSIDSKDKFSRHKILKEAIKSFENLNAQLDSEVTTVLLRGLFDSSESCRELCLGMLLKNVSCLTDLDKLVNTVKDRLGSENAEESEEIRSKLLLLLKTALSPQTAESYETINASLLLEIIEFGLKDNYHDSIRESCHIFEVIPLSILRKETAKTVHVSTLLFRLLKHKLSTVRISCLKAIKNGILFEPKLLLDQGVIAFLRVLIFDNNWQVRENLYNCLSYWMINLPDRYSYSQRLFPIFLYALKDESDFVSKRAHEQMDRIGETYEFDNIDKLKDELDLESHADGTRSRLGCRHFARDNLQVTMQQMGKDLSDESIERVIKSLDALLTLFDYAERWMSGYMSEVLPSLGTLSLHENCHIQKRLENLSLKITKYVSDEFIMKIMRHLIDECPSTRERAGLLRLVNHLLVGDPAGRCPLESILDIIKNPAVAYSTDKQIQKALLSLFETLTSFPAEILLSKHEAIFQTVTLALLIQYENFREESCHVLNLFARKLGANDTDSFLAHGLVSIVIPWFQRQGTSSENSVHLKIVDNFFKLCPSSWSDHSFFSIMLNEMIFQMANSETENGTWICGPRLSALNALKDNFKRLNKDLNLDILEKLLTQVIIPNMRWRRGAFEQTLRLVAIKCFEKFFVSFDKGRNESLFEILYPLLSDLESPKELFMVLTFCAEDDIVETRMATLRTLNNWFKNGLIINGIRIYVCNTYVEEQLCGKMLRLVMDRLDDAEVKCRLLVIELVGQISAQICYSQINDAEKKELYQKCLVHYHDSNVEINGAILELFKNIIPSISESLKNELFPKKNRPSDLVVIEELLRKVELC